MNQTNHKNINLSCSGGVDFAKCTKEQAFDFQCNILKTILQLENTFREMAERDEGNVLIVCDRGAMDPSACEEGEREREGEGGRERGRERERERERKRERERERVINCPFPVCSKEEWDEIIGSVGYNRVQIRDERYDQVIHMMTAADGAETFYQLSNNKTRSEGLELAIERDKKAADVRRVSVLLENGFLG